MGNVADYRPFPNLEAKNVVQERLEVPALVRTLRLPRAAAMLEVGCGRGVALVPLARLCAPSRLVGIDVDGDALAAARRRLDAARVDAELVEADVRALPFPDETFDVVVDFGTVYHIAAPELALAEIERVLRPGGWFVHETRLAQLVAHPVRGARRRVPFDDAALAAGRRSALWIVRVSAPPYDAPTTRRARSATSRTDEERELAPAAHAPRLGQRAATSAAPAADDANRRTRADATSPAS